MRTRRLTTGLGWMLGLTLLALLGLSAYGQRWDKRTELNVRERIEVPGAVLEPGRYVVKLVDSDSNRHIVRFLNEREDHVYSTVIAIPNYRLQATGDTAFSWYEKPAGQPPALRAWFYPGDNFGQEFVYPERQAGPIAAAAREPVPSVANEEEPAMVAEVQPEAPASAALKQAPIEPAEPPTQIAQAQPVPTPTPAPETTQPRELPPTAGAGFLFALLGVLTLSAGGVLHLLRRRARQL